MKIRNILLVTLSLYLSGCGSSGGSEDSAAAPVSVPEATFGSSTFGSVKFQ